ncbi:hypothetical protein ONZ45_g5813 [Pleurotus djamor]|nr:hypothetical protein ONZ45_g5813 [Pleurotus djamor]
MPSSNELINAVANSALLATETTLRHHVLNPPSSSSGLATTLNLFLEHLRHPPPPVSELLQCTDRLDHSVVLCRCTKHIIAYLRPNMLTNALFRDHLGLLSRIWPLLWYWVRDIFLCESIEESSMPVMIVKEVYGNDVLNARCLALFVCLSFSSFPGRVFLETVVCSPDFVSTMVYWWCLNVQDPDHPNANPLSLPALTLLLRGVQTAGEQWSDELVSAFGSPANFVACSLGYLCHASRDSNLRLLGDAIALIKHHTSSDLRLEFVRQNSIPLFIVVLIFLAKSPPSTEIDIQAQLQSCLCYLSHIFFLPTGQAHVWQAFDCGLIYALGTIANSVHCQELSSAFSQTCLPLLQAISVQLFFRKNFRAASKDFKRLAPLTSIKWQDHKLDVNWTHMTWRVDQYRRSKMIYVILGKTCRTCGLRDSPYVGRCSTCGVHYCSRICQTHDWTRHRAECSPGILLQPDGHFIVSLVYSILDQCKDHIGLYFQKYVLMHPEGLAPKLRLVVNCSAYPVIVGAHINPSEGDGAVGLVVPGDITKSMSIQTVMPTHGFEQKIFDTLLGHLRISPPPTPLGLYPLLSQNDEDPYQKVSIVSFGQRQSSSGAFYDYSARYGAVRDQDKITLRESVFPETIDNAVGELGYRQYEQKKVDPARMALFENLAERMGLTRFLDLPVVALSNGQTRRARVVKAILGSPELLLLDEPLTGLDVQTRPSLLALLHELHTTRTPRIILGLREQDSIPDWITHIAHVSGSRVHAGTRREIEPLLGSSERVGEQRVVKHTSGSETGEILVDMKNVNVQYGKRSVLQSINWKIRAGDRWHLVGSNGSGKTTLLSLITGDHPQSYTQSSSQERHLRLFSLPRQRIPTPVLHSQIGLVSPELFDAFPRRTGLTVWEAVVTGFEGVFSVPRGSSQPSELNVGGKVGEEMSKEEWSWRVKQVWDVIEKLGPASWDISIESEQRMVLLMRALVGKPKLVLLDEVWSGMDEGMINAARSYLRGSLGDDQAVVVITHWENEVPWGNEDGVKRYLLDSGKGSVV